MKNVEKKELLEILDEILKNDRKEDLLQLIENDIIDERMCQSKHLEVREKLAKNRYFIDILIKEEGDIRYNTYKWLIKNNKLEQKHIDYVIQQDDYHGLVLLIKNGIVDERMCQSQHEEVRKELVNNGYFIDILIKDKDENIRFQAYKWLIRNNKLKQQHIDYAIQQDSYIVLLLLFKKNIVNERMCQSRHYKIREKLVKKEYFIDILIKDENENVRYQAYKWLIRNNKLEQQHIDYAIQQDNYDILLLLLENGIVDERMYQSRRWKVREELAKNGYFVDNLICDHVNNVRYRAYEWLVNNNKIEPQHISNLVIKKEFDLFKRLLILKNKSNEESIKKISKKIKQIEEERKSDICLLINNKNILKNNS